MKCKKCNGSGIIPSVLHVRPIVWDTCYICGGSGEVAVTTVVNIRDHPDWQAEGGVYIGRGFRGQKASMAANPFHIGRDGNREEVIVKYKSWFSMRIWGNPEFNETIEAMRGKMLVCWCAPEKCHGNVIVEYLEGGSDG